MPSRRLVSDLIKVQAPKVPIPTLNVILTHNVTREWFYSFPCKVICFKMFQLFLFLHPTPVPGGLDSNRLGLKIIFLAQVWPFISNLSLRGKLYQYD